MGQAEQQHLDWLARAFGRGDYVPLNRSDFDLIERVGEVLTPSPGTQLFKEGDSAAVFLVDTGEVDVYRGTAAKPRVLGRVGPGSVLGDIAVFEHTVHKWSARAVGSVRVVRVERSRLLRELAMHPGLSLRWMAAGLRQLEATQRRVVELMHKPVLARVADLLADEAHGGNEVNLSQATIATLLGVSRQSINEALGELRERGLVDTGYRQIRILDDAGLGDVAGF